MALAIPKIRSHLNDSMIPKVKAIFEDIRQNKKHKDNFDENKFKEQIFDDVFETIET